jgi:hypothetical protein
MSSSITSRTLSSDAWAQVLKDCNAKDIAHFSQVCQTWNTSLEQDSFWKRIFSLHFPSEKHHGIKNFKEAYKAQYLYEQNLKYGMCTQLQFQSPEPPVTYGKWLATTRSKLFASCSPHALNSLSHAASINFWDIKSLEYLGSLEGHQADICWLFIADDTLFSASIDGKIWVRDAETNELLATLDGLATGLCSPLVADQKLFFPSNEGQICIWDVKSRTLLTTLKISSEEVACLLVDNDKLFAASNKGKIYIWDLQSLTFLTTLTSEDFNQRVFSLAALKTMLFVGDSEKVGIWDLETSQIITPLRGSPGDEEVTSLCIVDGKLYCLFYVVLSGLPSSSYYKVIALDLESSQLTRLESQTYVSSLLIEKGKLFTPSAAMICVRDSSRLYNLHTYAGGIRSVAIANECVFAACVQNVIKFDFTANYPAILKQIADYLEGKEERRIFDAKKKLSRMPPSIKNQIYLNENDLDAFSHPFKTTQDIRKYLNPSKCEFLDCFGIVTREQYFKQFSCTPEYLEAIGITSAEDLEVLCPLSSHIQPLEIESQAIGVREENSIEAEVQSKANQRKTALSSLCPQILQTVSAKIQEAKTCHTAMRTSPNIVKNRPDAPWIDFQEDLDGFFTRFNALPRKIVKAFTAEEYNKLARELNALVERFHTLDREFQIIKLHVYINRREVFEAWLDLHARGIRRLIDLPEEEKHLKQLFQISRDESIF